MNCYSDNLLSFENVLRSSYLGPIRQQVHPRVRTDVERRFNGLGEMVTRIASVEKDVEDIKSRHERTRQTIRKLIDEGEL